MKSKILTITVFLSERIFSLENNCIPDAMRHFCVFFNLSNSTKHSLLLEVFISTLFHFLMFYIQG